MVTTPATNTNNTSTPSSRTPRRLHVAAADAIAKSRRAADAASLRMVSVAAGGTLATDTPPDPSTTPITTTSNNFNSSYPIIHPRAHLPADDPPPPRRNTIHHYAVATDPRPPTHHNHHPPATLLDLPAEETSSTPAPGPTPAHQAKTSLAHHTQSSSSATIPPAHQHPMSNNNNTSATYSTNQLPNAHPQATNRLQQQREPRLANVDGHSHPLRAGNTIVLPTEPPATFHSRLFSDIEPADLDSTLRFADPSMPRSAPPNFSMPSRTTFGHPSDLHRHAAPGPRFTTAPDDPNESTPGPLAALIALVLRRDNIDPQLAPGGSSASANNRDKARRPRQAPLKLLLGKALPSLEKAAGIISSFPDPTIFVLLYVLVVLSIHVVQLRLLETLVAKAVIIMTFVPVLSLALLWRKTDMLTSLREGQNPFVHPAEDEMEDLETEMKLREVRLAAATAALKKSRRQLEDLKKELFKDPAALEPDAIIVPSKKAAAMIAAGALGTTFDRETTEAVEAKRKLEAKHRLQQEWKRKAEASDELPAETKENLQRLVNHAATLYSARTKELRIKSGAGPSNTFSAANFQAFRSGLNKVVPIPGQAGFGPVKARTIGTDGGQSHQEHIVDSDHGSARSTSSQGSRSRRQHDETRSLGASSTDAYRQPARKRRTRLGLRGVGGEGGSVGVPEFPELTPDTVPTANSTPLQKPRRSFFRKKQGRLGGMGVSRGHTDLDRGPPSPVHSSRPPSEGGSM